MIKVYTLIPNLAKSNQSFPTILGNNSFKYRFVRDRSEQEHAGSYFHRVITENLIDRALVVEHRFRDLYKVLSQYRMIDVLVCLQSSIDTIEKRRTTMSSFNACHLRKDIPYPMRPLESRPDFLEGLGIRTYLITLVDTPACAIVCIQESLQIGSPSVDY